MSFSFSRIILSETEIEDFDQGKQLFEREMIVGKRIGTAAYRAEVKDPETFFVSLGFYRIGSPRYSCTCEYFRKHFKPCAHIIASALVWDQERMSRLRPKNTLRQFRGCISVDARLFS